MFFLLELLDAIIHNLHNMQQYESKQLYWLMSAANQKIGFLIGSTWVENNTTYS